jgi:hypothetical protein
VGERTRLSQWLGLSPHGFKSALDMAAIPVSRRRRKCRTGEAAAGFPRRWKFASTSSSNLKMDAYKVAGLSRTAPGTAATRGAA